MKGTRPQRLFSDWSFERTACSALEKEHPQEVCVCVCVVLHSVQMFLSVMSNLNLGERKKCGLLNKTD